MSESSRPIPIDDLLRHHAWVRTLARSLVRDEDTADDLEQSTWLAALRAAPRTAAAARAWLRTVMRRLAVDRFRSDSARRLREEEAGTATEAGEASAAIDDVVVRAETHRGVVEAVLALEEPYRTTVLLRFFEDLPPRAVASRMGVPAETVRTRTRRAIERLRESLAGPGNRDRRSIAILLAPLLGEGRPAPWIHPGAAAAIGTGGLIMTTMKVGAVTAAVIALAAGVFLATRERPAGDGVGASPSRQPGAASARSNGGEPAGAAPRTVEDRKGPETAQAPPSSAPEEKAGLILLVRREDGAPAAGARVVLYDGEAVMSSGLLDASGVCSLPLPERDAEVAVKIPASPLVLDSVEAGTREKEIVLPAGSAIAGIVLLDGLPPGDPVPLRLFLRGEIRPWTPPDGIFDALGLEANPSSTAIRTGEGGEFRFQGLPAGAIAHISVPMEFPAAIEDPLDGAAYETFAGGVEVEAPREDLVIRLRRMPSLRGRIVRAGGEPAPGSAVEVVWNTGTGGSLARTLADPEGRFEVALPSSEFQELTVLVTGPEGIGRREYPISGRVEPRRDLGDLPIAPSSEKSMRILVLDPEGRPVPGAAAVVEMGDLPELPATGEMKAWSSPPAGEDGLLEIPAGEEGRTAIVGAAGFDPREVVVTATGDEPLRVALSPGTILRVRASGPGGIPPNAFVRITGPESTFIPAIQPNAPLSTALGLTDPVEFSFSDEGTCAEFRPPGSPEGTIAISALRPGTPLRLELLGGLGEVLDVEAVQLAPGEIREVTLEAPRPARTLSGAVRGEDGKPIQGAWIEVRGTEPSIPGRIYSLTVLSDGDGRFEVPGIYREAVRVLVAATGRVPAFLARVDLTRPGDEGLAVMLERGRTVRVRVRDAEGRLVDGATVYALVPGIPLVHVEESPWQGHGAKGEYEISGLPRGVVEIVVGAAGVARRVAHDTATSELTVTVGERKEDGR